MSLSEVLRAMSYLINTGQVSGLKDFFLSLEKSFKDFLVHKLKDLLSIYNESLFSKVLVDNGASNAESREVGLL